MGMPDVPGNCPIIATPFTDDEEIDYESLRHEIRTLSEKGCEAATMFGMASEFHKLSGDERRRVAEVVTGTAEDADIASVLSVTHEATSVAVEHAEEYDALGADCIMVFPPRERATTEEIVNHVGRIGRAVDAPVMVQHTTRNVDIPPDEFAALHEEIPNVRFFKIELNPPGEYISRLDDATGDDVSILVGNWGYKMMDAYDRGAVGVMPIAVYPELYVEMHRRYRDGDREGAVELHDELLSFLNDIQGIGHAKRVMADCGLIETPHSRPPVGEAPDEVADERFEEAHERMLSVVADI